MKRIALATALALVLPTAACSKVTYTNPAVRPVGGPQESTGAFFIGGLVGTHNIAAYQMCPGGVSEIQSKFTFGDLVLTMITLFIYSPRTYEITCGQ